MKLSLAKKLYFLIFPTVLVSTIVGFIAWGSLNMGTSDLKNAGDLVDFAMLSRLHVTEMSDSMKGYILNPSDEAQAENKKKADENNSAALVAMKKLTTDPEMLKIITETKEYDDSTLDPAEQKVMALIKDGKLQLAQEFFVKDYLPKREVYNQLSIKLNEKAHAFSESAVISIGNGMKSAGNWIIISLIFGSAVLAGLISYLTVTITRSLREVGFNIDEAATTTSSSSGQLSKAAQQLSAGVSEGAASLEETVAAIEELSSMVKLTADSAKEAATLSQSSRRSAEEGEVEIKKLINSVSEVAKSSKEIEEIINVIDDIAFQTNLLALNAAVEAARAGEQGKGFAVVAEAVRNLAQRSAVAAKEITKLIKGSVEKAEGGLKVADKSGVLLNEIVTSVKKVAELNVEISNASQQQSTGLFQINKAMTQLDQVTQSNAASAEEAASSSAEMSEKATTLLEQAEKLTLLIEGA